MTRKLFGTDGVRGTANREPITAETALKLAMAAGSYFTPVSGKQRPLAVIGKDTRLSGYMLESAMVAGFTAVGMDVVLVGPMVTPGIAMLTRSLRADLGVMLSASHNPYHDNGIKFFGPDGFKLSDEIELSLENIITSIDDSVRVSPMNLGRARRLDDAAGRYIEMAKGTFPKGLRLDGLKLVVDCANGAAYKLAPKVFFELGADIVALGVEPDGFNINRDCGAMAPASLIESVKMHKADAGIALDGDADRLILVDETGSVVDGDQILAALAASWLKTGELKGDGIVTTVMSNHGLEVFLNSKGLKVYRTNVGDRYVLEYMRQNGFNLGGEQSGHIIMSDYSSTGDGIIAALKVLSIALTERKPISEITRAFKPVPQLLKNIQIRGAQTFDEGKLRTISETAEKRIGKKGRVLIRKSGTEPVLRVMVESEDEVLMQKIVDDISSELFGNDEQ